MLWKMSHHGSWEQRVKPLSKNLLVHDHENEGSKDLLSRSSVHAATPDGEI
jgi:hypothetical protein